MSRVNETIDFGDLEVIEIPVNVGSESYILKEASGKAACEYRNAMLACTTLGPEGRPTSLRNLANVEPLLVSLCLFSQDGKRVPQDKISAWPARVQKTLFNKIKEISELGEESPERIALEKALQLDDSPVSLDQFKEWIEALPEDNFAILKVWFMTEGEPAKNVPSDTTDG